MDALNIEYYTSGGVLHSRQSPTAEVDPEAMDAYRQGEYVNQAPFDLLADHYGRAIQVMLAMDRLTGEDQWLALATEIADEAVGKLWRERIFVGHELKTH